MSAINSEYSQPNNFASPYLTSCARTFRGGTFNFYIGPDEVHFILYKNLVSRYSEPLGSMMTNGMKESHEGRAFLKDVDPDTFCRFAEFVHSGDYSAAAPVEVPLPPAEVPPAEDAAVEMFPAEEPSAEAPPEEAPPAEEPESIAGYDWGWVPRTQRKKRTRTAPPPPLPFPVDPAPGLNHSPDMSYTQTFARHISVYHFAKLYLVAGLKELATQKLSEALNLFQCYPERATDICHIVRLVYNHEDGNTHPSPLHDTISDYATNNFKVLMASRHFKDLLAEGGLFPPDVCSKVADLLN